ncbi:MAG TPA: hypothetical protein DIC18_04595 [Clostridiales bacterium]|nr:hypothetical protein [Clostridiales bacterium]
MRKERVHEILSDVFDLADRVKEVDEEYRLYYNLDRGRYEVRKRGEICITWYEDLSAALITKLRETHVRRRNELLAEIEKGEERAQREQEHLARERIGTMTENYLSKGRVTL